MIFAAYKERATFVKSTIGPEAQHSARNGIPSILDISFFATGDLTLLNDLAGLIEN
ncbi:hypothetical protein GCM10028805_64160 [Spirosoma harenae]